MKERREPCVTDSGTRVSGSSSSRPRRRSPAFSPRLRGLRQNREHQRDPRSLANRLTPFSPRRSHRKGLAVDHGSSAEVLGDMPSSQAGRACPRVSYSTSELRRSFQGRWLGSRRCGEGWPREDRTPVETRRRCASYPATVSMVECPPSGVDASYGPKLPQEPNQRGWEALRSSALGSPDKNCSDDPIWGRVEMSAHRRVSRRAWGWKL